MAVDDDLGKVMAAMGRMATKAATLELGLMNLIGMYVGDINAAAVVCKGQTGGQKRRMLRERVVGSWGNRYGSVLKGVGWIRALAFANLVGTAIIVGATKPALAATITVEEYGLIRLLGEISQDDVPRLEAAISRMKQS